MLLLLPLLLAGMVPALLIIVDFNSILAVTLSNIHILLLPLLLLQAYSWCLRCLALQT
jgi:hypothetical protein